MIDHTEAEQLPDAGFGDAVLELGQPAVRNEESFVAFDFGNSAAGLFDLADSDVAVVPKRLELLTGRHSCPRK